ncbi:Serologically defined colon cancer antigen 8-like [Paramuricea clavata]|uniref:Serologically defined colon cancer antigen 8-like n=1 Tax=Paramuricea clavata TaxID=317549 RepID=A0A6S7HKU7_PARCT|nr:Serologically defined colon cancer antigen 8-like [Paramuricea clavata]
MDFEEQRQEEHAVRHILSEDLGETLRGRHDIVPPLLTRSEQDKSSFQHNERFHEYNINIAVDIVDTDYQEVENKFADSIVEIEGAKVFPCSNCSKICKSKGGLMKHTNSKHGDPHKVSSPLNTAPLCFDTIESIVETIKSNIITEKLYGDEINSVVKNISATEALLKDVLLLYTKFCQNRNQDKLLESFYGLMLNSSKLLNC